jgi:FKBP-type peptidyl-prolyl cis-trans isomerase
MIQRITICLLSAVLLSACLKDTVTFEQQLEMDIKKIKDYLNANNLTAQESTSGLHYIIEEEGDGDNPELNLEIVVSYKGYLLDGTVFDQTAMGQSVTFALGGVIAGWQEGLQYFKKGGKGKLFMPSYMGYGPTQVGSIPPNSVLAFDVTLLDVLTEERRKELDKEKIQNYLKANNLTADSTTSGLYYIIEAPGEGGFPTLASTINVRYKGYLLNGTIFDQTQGTQTVNFVLGSVIKGWQEGLQLFQKGGKGTLFIPAHLGYGASRVGNIPPYSVLIFDVELVNF